MTSQNEIEWDGLGRWLSFTAAALMIVFAVPFVMEADQGAAAGWNIFLGLLLFGTIASNNARAPLLVSILTILMIVRLIVLVAMSWDLFGFISNALLLMLLGTAAYDLRGQATNV